MELDGQGDEDEVQDGAGEDGAPGELDAHHLDAAADRGELDAAGLAFLVALLAAGDVLPAGDAAAGGGRGAGRSPRAPRRRGGRWRSSPRSWPTTSTARATPSTSTPTRTRTPPRSSTPTTTSTPPGDVLPARTRCRTKPTTTSTRPARRRGRSRRGRSPRGRRWRSSPTSTAPRPGVEITSRGGSIRRGAST